MSTLNRMPRAEADAFAMIYLGGEQIPCRTLNISVSGLLLTSSVRRQIGQPLKIEFSLGESVGFMCLDAVLVREERRGQGFLWGLKFCNLDFWVREYLTGYIDEIAGCRAVA